MKYEKWMILLLTIVIISPYDVIAGSGCGIEKPFQFKEEIGSDEADDGCVVATTKEARQTLAKVKVRWKKAPWTSCSKSCGGGEKSRVYYCVSGLQEEQCQNNKTFTLDCNTHICAGWSVWGDWTNSEFVSSIYRRFRLCIDVESDEVVDNEECKKHYGEDTDSVTQIRYVSPLPWTDSSTPGSPGDCLPNCESADCQVIAYDPTADLCFTGSFDFSTPRVLVDEASPFAWTLTLFGDDSTAEWMAVSEDSNIMTASTTCMANIVLSTKTDTIGDELTQVVPNQFPDERIDLMKYFKKHGAFFGCSLNKCYTWHFGHQDWKPSHTPPNQLAGVSFVFMDEEEDKLFIAGGRLSSSSDMTGAKRLYFYTVSDGFETGPTLSHPGISMGLVRIPHNGILYCGGYNDGYRKNCHIYNLTTSTSRAVPNLVHSDYGMAMNVLKGSDGKDFVILASGARFAADSFKFDLETETWSTLGPPQPSYGLISNHRDVVIDNKMYLMGFRTGTWSGPLVDDELVYDPQLPGWRVEGTVRETICEGGRQIKFPFTALVYKNV